MNSFLENEVDFLFDKEKLIDNFFEYQKVGSIYYPLKTNSNVNVLFHLNEIFRKQDGFLISTIKQFHKLMDLGVDVKRIGWMNVLSGIETIRYLYQCGIRYFVFDDRTLLIEFKRFANLKECRISLRLSTMEVYPNCFTHLGATTQDILLMISQIDQICLDYGISFYLQDELKENEHALECMLDCIRLNFSLSKIRFISIAGLKFAKELSLDYMKRIKKQLKIEEIILEPGRYLVEDTIDLKTRIIRVRRYSNRMCVVLKNGLYSGFFDTLLYQKKFQFYFISKHDGLICLKHERESTDDYEVYIYGGSADSRDVIGSMYIDHKYKYEITENQFFIIKEIGAYFEELFMNYGTDISCSWRERENYEIQNV